MRNLIILFLFLFASKGLTAQTVVDPKDFPVEANPSQSNFEFYTRKTGQNKKATFDGVRKGMLPCIKTVSYIPASSGNTSDKGCVVTDTNGDIWYIDGAGDAVLVGGVSYTAGTGISIVGGEIRNTGDLSNTNEIQTISISGSVITLNKGGGSVTIPTLPTYTGGTGINITGALISNIGDLSATNEGALTISPDTDSTAQINSNTSGSTPVKIKVRSPLSISEDGSTVLIEADSTVLVSGGAAGGDLTGSYPDPTVVGIYGNPVLSTAPSLGNVLKWNGSAWDALPDSTTTYTAGTGISVTGTVIANTAPDQTVVVTGATGTYPNFTLPDASATNELQTISTTGAAGNITLSDGGGTLNLNVNDADASTTNEIQNLSLTGQALGISSGTGVNLPVVGVAAGTGIGVASSAGVVTVTNTGDLSTTNEIQTLSYSAPNLSLSGGGGSVAIPQGTITGTGTTNYLSKFSSSTAISNSQIFDNGTNVGIGFASPTYPLHYYKYTKGLRMGVFGDDNTGNQSLPNYVGIDFQGYAGYVYGSIAAADRAAAVAYGGLAFFADPDVSVPTNTLRMFINGQNGNVGIGTDVLPSQKLHIKNGSLLIDNGNFLVQNNNADFTAGFIESTAASLAANDRQYISFGHLGGELGKMGGVWSGTTYDFFIDGYAGAFNRVATFKGTGKVGIGTTTPATLLDIAGDFKLTTRTGTATTIAGFGSDNICRDVAIGAGLSLSGGTLSSTATGTVTGTGTAGKVAYWSGTGAITSTTNFPFDGTSLAVGRSTAGAGRFNVTGNSTSVGLQVDAGALPDFGATVQMRSSNAAQTIYGIDAEGNTGGSSNYLNKFFNTGTGSTVLQLGATSGGTGDAVVQYNITGGGSTWIEGVDNSDTDKFKIQPTSSLGGVSTGLTITTGGLFGINNQSPGASIDMDNTTDGIALSSGNTANRPASGLRWLRYNSSMFGLETKTTTGGWHVLNSSQSVNLGAGTALGTAPTITINNGTEMAYTVSLTVGTAPVANAVIYTRTFPSTWSVAPTVVFSAANQVTASEITKFYVDTQTTGQYTIRVNGTLSTPQTYKLNVIVRN
jgi:hypothetical protein